MSEETAHLGGPSWARGRVCRDGGDGGVPLPWRPGTWHWTTASPPAALLHPRQSRGFRCPQAGAVAPSNCGSRTPNAP